VNSVLLLLLQELPPFHHTLPTPMYNADFLAQPGCCSHSISDVWHSICQFIWQFTYLSHYPVSVAAVNCQSLAFVSVSVAGDIPNDASSLGLSTVAIDLFSDLDSLRASAVVSSELLSFQVPRCCGDGSLLMVVASWVNGQLSGCYVVVSTQGRSELPLTSVSISATHEASSRGKNWHFLLLCFCATCLLNVYCTSYSVCWTLPCIVRFVSGTPEACHTFYIPTCTGLTSCSQSSANLSQHHGPSTRWIAVHSALMSTPVFY